MKKYIHTNWNLLQSIFPTTFLVSLHPSLRNGKFVGIWFRIARKTQIRFLLKQTMIEIRRLIFVLPLFARIIYHMLFFQKLIGLSILFYFLEFNLNMFMCSMPYKEFSIK